MSTPKIHTGWCALCSLPIYTGAIWWPGTEEAECICVPTVVTTSDRTEDITYKVASTKPIPGNRGYEQYTLSSEPPIVNEAEHFFEVDNKTGKLVKVYYALD